MKNIFRNRNSICHIAVVCLFATVFTVACSEDPVTDEPDNNDIKYKAEYNLIILGGGESEAFVGENIESNWDSSLGIVWLGTDENNLPTGTLTITIDTIVTNPGISQAIISSATLSTSDKLEGTSAEINAKLYFSLSGDELLELGTEHGFQWVDSVEIGANYISGNIGGWTNDDDLEGWAMKDANTGEIHFLFGSFTAIVKRPGW